MLNRIIHFSFSINKYQETVRVNNLDVSRDVSLLPGNYALSISPETARFKIVDYFYEGALAQLSAMAHTLHLHRRGNEDDAKNSVEALKHRKLGVKSSENTKKADYLVLDNAVTEEVLLQLYDTVCLSTVWYDAVNGACVAAHMDDGLGVSRVLRDFVQVCLALYTFVVYHTPFLLIFHSICTCTLFYCKFVVDFIKFLTFLYFYCQLLTKYETVFLCFMYTS